MWAKSALAAALLFCTSAQGDPRNPPASTVISLNGPWKFNIGDNPRWADPNFDDSNWQNYTIDPKHLDLTVAQILQSGPLHGWQRHGHPGYTGYAWYRMRVQNAPGKQSLALLMPQYVDDSYEIYVNGVRIGIFGELDGHHLVYVSRPLVFPISAAAPFTLAIRFWNQRYEALPSQENLHGGMRAVPLLGPSALLEIYRQRERDQVLESLVVSWSTVCFYGPVGLISLFLFLFSRGHREYLWAGLSLTAIAAMLVLTFVQAASSAPVQFTLPLSYLAECIGFFALPLAAMYLLGVEKNLWRRLNVAALGLIFLHLLISLGLHLGMLPPTIVWQRADAILLRLSLCVLALLLLAIAVDSLRTLGRKAWLPLTPGLLFACALVAQVGDTSPIALLKLYWVLYTSVPVAVLVIFLLRFSQQQRENALLIEDMRQAREVQNLLLPAQLPRVAGFRIESVYLPAREVGGDFFQVLEGPENSILIVIGDVAGKGLPAAMLVALLVGAIRTRAEDTHHPARILETLNERLCGRTQGAFATCLAARISAIGTVEVANAGHLPPYVNGREIELEGALPLGAAAEILHETHTFTLEPGARLTFVSDGVVEAKNGSNELFGFDRTRALSTQRAQVIASAAQHFGHQDDITVLIVERATVAAYVV